VRRETSDRVGRAWGRSRDQVDRPDRSSMRRFEPAPRGGSSARIFRGGDRPSRGEGPPSFRMPSRERSIERQAQPRVDRGREFRAPERTREAPPPQARSNGNGWGRGNGDEQRGNGGGRKR
jgi:hypothetical protein